MTSNKYYLASYTSEGCLTYARTDTHWHEDLTTDVTLYETEAEAAAVAAQMTARRRRLPQVVAPVVHVKAVNPVNIPRACRTCCAALPPDGACTACGDDDDNVTCALLETTGGVLVRIILQADGWYVIAATARGDAMAWQEYDRTLDNNYALKLFAQAITRATDEEI
jgi:hypothetical protein